MFRSGGFSTPVIERNKIKIIIGIGNKTEAHTSFDLTRVQLVATTLQAIMRQRQVEETLSLARERLEQRVQEGTAELSKTNGALRRKTEERLLAEARVCGRTKDGGHRNARRWYRP
jgi:C4-dicarboxylate-specific signal transduction histidine kinase